MKYLTTRVNVALLSTTMLLSGCSFVQPDPLSTQEHAQLAMNDIAGIYDNQKPLQGELSLEEAIARAMLYNLDHRMAMMEQVLQDNQLTLANFEMLPQLAANAGYVARDEFRASQSISLLTRSQSLEPSYSEDRDIITADLSFSWSILDFGLGYYQAKQQADRTMIAVERRRRVMNNLVKQVRTAYWKAASAEKLLPRIEPILEDVDSALTASRQIEDEGLDTPMAILDYRRNLLKLLTQLKRLKADLYIAKSELAQLVNVPVGSEFTLAMSENDLQSLPTLDAPLDVLQQHGLSYRPELREENYQSRIDKHNVTKEVLRVFPNLSFLSSVNYNNNSLLSFNDWREAGVRATWNLMRVLQAPAAIEAAESAVDVANLRRMALGAAVMTQVSISYEQYNQAVDTFGVANELSQIEEQMLGVSEDALAAESGTSLDVIQKKVQAVASTLEKDRKLADAQTAYANLLLSIGLDPVPAGVESASLEELTKQVKHSLDYVNQASIAPLMDAWVAEAELEDVQAETIAESAKEEPAYMPVEQLKPNIKSYQKNNAGVLVVIEEQTL